MSTSSQGEVLSLFVTPPTQSRPIAQECISVDEEGIIGDKHYTKTPERTILLTSIESYRLAQQYEITMPYSSLGENILLDFNPYALPLGTRFSLGSAILEISQHCTLCKHLATIDRRIPKLLKNDRGIFAKVIQEGEIARGDRLYLL